MQCAQRSTPSALIADDADGADNVRLAVVPASLTAEVVAVLSAAAVRSLRVFLQACLWPGLRLLG